MQGPFAFIIFDHYFKRVVVARDPEGREPLFWTSSANGQSLFFSTDRLALYDHPEHITEFPGIPISFVWCG